MLQPRTVVFCRFPEAMPTAVVPGPPERPPSLNPLQSIVTLFAATMIASPVPGLNDRSRLKHHVPCVSRSAGRLVMYPVQASKLLAACDAPGAAARASRGYSRIDRF